MVDHHIDGSVSPPLYHITMHLPLIFTLLATFVTALPTHRSHASETLDLSPAERMVLDGERECHGWKSGMRGKCWKGRWEEQLEGVLGDWITYKDFT